MHRVLEFDKSKWPKPYIKFNTQKEIEAKHNDSKDGKAFHKLMNNNEYNKTMENLKNRVDLRLANYNKHYLKWTSKPITYHNKYLTTIW